MKWNLFQVKWHITKMHHIYSRRTAVRAQSQRIPTTRPCISTTKTTTTMAMTTRTIMKTPSPRNQCTALMHQRSAPVRLRSGHSGAAAVAIWRRLPVMMRRRVVVAVVGWMMDGEVQRRRAVWSPVARRSLIPVLSALIVLGTDTLISMIRIKRFGKV